MDAITPRSAADAASDEAAGDDAADALTPTRVAQLADISVSYASEILTGKRRPSAALARVLDEKCGMARHVLRPDIFDPPAPTDTPAPTPASCGKGGEFAPRPGLEPGA